MFTRALALLTALFLAIGVAAAPYAYAQAKKNTAPAPAKTAVKPAATPEGGVTVFIRRAASMKPSDVRLGRS